jgi:uncharacterized protein (DUF952 family)
MLLSMIYKLLTTAEWEAARPHDARGGRDALGDTLRWEPSRGGALFPHLYASLSVEAIVTAVTLDEDLPVADAVAAAL